MRLRRNPSLAAALAVCALAAGCYVAKSPGPQSPLALDPCAERLHDLSGRLLLYRRTQGRLPPTLADLPAQGNAAEEFACPASGRPYVYRLDGPAAPGGAGRMAVYDAAPSHNGGRWAVAVAEPAAGPMTARVLWVAEADFQAALATAGKPVKP